MCAVAFHEHQNTPAVRANLDLSFLQRVHTRVTEREEVCFDAANVTSNDRRKRGLGGDERVNKGDFYFDPASSLYCMMLRSCKGVM